MSQNNVVETLSKNKLKHKLTKLKAVIREKGEAAKNRWETFAKNLDKIDEEIANSSEIKKYVPRANSREKKDFNKRMQILEWFYNGRSLLANETALWANGNSETKFKADNQGDIKHSVEGEFYTIETGSQEKVKQVPTIEKHADMAKTDAASVKLELTSIKPAEPKRDSEDLDSARRNGSKESAKSKEAETAKMSAKTESESDTSEEIADNDRVSHQAADPKEREIIHRFAPMKDGSSSSESTSIS